MSRADIRSDLQDMSRHVKMHPVQINGAALRAIRERSLMTQEALAVAVGIDQGSLSNIERGFRNASGDVAVALATVLKVELPAILADPAEARS